MTDGIDFVPLVSGKSSSLNVRNPRSWLQRPPSRNTLPLSHDNLGSSIFTAGRLLVRPSRDSDSVSCVDELLDCFCNLVLDDLDSHTPEDRIPRCVFKKM